MVDLRLRRLQRASAQGDEASAARLLHERLRAGSLSRARLRLAAYLGDRPARVALGEEAPPPAPARFDPGRWPGELAELLDQEATRSLLVAACVERQRQLLGWLDGAVVAELQPLWEGLGAVWRYCAQPGSAQAQDTRSAGRTLASLTPLCERDRLRELARLATRVYELCRAVGAFESGSLYGLDWPRLLALPPGQAHAALCDWALGRVPRSLALGLVPGEESPRAPAWRRALGELLPARETRAAAERLRAAVAAGTLRPERLELAAFAGEPGAHHALGRRAPTQPADLVTWMEGVGTRSREACVLAALALARALLPLWEHARPGDERLSAAIGAGERWTRRAPLRDARRRAQEAACEVHAAIEATRGPAQAAAVAAHGALRAASQGEPTQVARAAAEAAFGALLVHPPARVRELACAGLRPWWQARA